MNLAELRPPLFASVCLLAVCFAATAPHSAAQSHVMITDDSRLEDASGAVITRDTFTARFESGRFAPVAILDADGATIGYRLVPRNSDADEAQTAGDAQRAIDSSSIDGPVTVELIRHGHLFLPVEILDGETWHRVLVVLDTGTFVPLILDPELDVERVDRMVVGGVEFSSFATGRFEPFDMIRDMNRLRDEHPDLFDDRPIVGIAGVSLFENYLVSIDAGASQLTLRPRDSEQRTLTAGPPVASTTYDDAQSNIWFPVTVDGVEGHGHYDTGSPYTFVAAGLSGEAGEVPAIVVGGVDLTEHRPDFPTRAKDLDAAYASVPHDVILQLGGEGSDRWIVTIDAREGRLYFEAPE